MRKNQKRNPPQMAKPSQKNGLSSTPKKSGGGGNKGGGNGPPINVTRPEEYLNHEISEEQLTMLVHGQKDGISEAVWAFMGAALGTAPSALTNICNYLNTEKIARSDFLEVLIFLISIFICVALHTVSKNKKKAIDDMVTEIRKRKKTNVTR